MMFSPMVLGIMDPLYELFGKAMNILYGWLGNYGLVLIVVAVILKLVTMPPMLKSQKSTLRQSFLNDDINEIKRVYAKDPQAQQEAQAKLMKDAGLSMGGGCLTALLPMFFFIAMWRPIQRPFFYVAQVSMENITNIATFLRDKGAITEAVFKNALSNSDISIMNALRNNASYLYESVQNGWLKVEQLLSMDFLGLDLGVVPTFNPKLLFGAETARIYLPHLILPILVIVTMMISMQMAKLNQLQTKSKEERERERRNPAKDGQTPEQQGQNMMKVMNWTMPVLMLFSVFSFPAAMGLYWVVQNLLSIAQSLIGYYCYVLPARKLLAEASVSSAELRRAKRKSEV